MRTRITTLTLFAATLAAAVVAGAQNQPGPERPMRNQAGFECPVCGSPCVSKAVLQRQMRQRRMQHQDAQPFRQNDRVGAESKPWQQDRERQPQQLKQQARQQEREQFDFDEDGQLSYAERAARRAYRDALERTQDAQPSERPGPRQPVD